MDKKISERASAQRGKFFLSAPHRYAVAKPAKVLNRERENLGKSLSILEIVGLRHLRNELATNLSGGQRKMLEVARALMTEPELLLLDEPTAGATFEETRKLMEYIETLRKEHGLTFLIVEHKMEVIMNLCDKIFLHPTPRSEGWFQSRPRRC